jgi:D-beta-D-heptose 7-phosphate kinase/D-beta-D-heptose 1-phosphate adenosyltransferase
MQCGERLSCVQEPLAPAGNRMRAKEKIKTVPELQALCMEKQSGGCRVVFTNGCFDLLHLGHIRCLEEARGLGDLLVVAVNSDVSVRAIKGPLRPLLPQEERVELLAALQCVDYVTLFDAPDPLALIKMLRPDVLVKGADWSRDTMVGADLVESCGGRVVQIPLVPGLSTTRIIRKILDHYGTAKTSCHE